MAKRTDFEVQKSIAKGDLTGGYSFLPWLIYVDKNWIRIAIGLILILTGCFLLTPKGMEQSFVSYKTQSIIAYTCIAAGIFIMAWTIRMYNRLKKGISD